MRQKSAGNIVRAGVIVALLLCCSTTLRAATPEQVDAAIKKAIASIYAAEQTDNWESTPAPDPKDAGHEFWTGQTALDIYALLAAGESPQANPKLAAAIEWLKKNNTKGIYALGMRAQVWNLLPHDKDQSIRDAIKHDAELLLEGARKKGDVAGFRGLYHYVVASRDYDSSCSQYGVLGMWALERAGLEVPDAYWQSVEDAWKKNQDKSGGWCYVKGAEDKHPVSINMTAAGIATLFITQDYLSGMNGIKCTGNAVNEPIAKAMAWMEAQVPTALQSGKVDLYGLYGIERIGVASGYKYFGTLDWYKEGSDFLVKKMAAGGWVFRADFKTTGLAFGTLFLTRGRAPVVMNKLQYNITADKADKGDEGHWNQRPRDAANAVKYVAKQMERDLNWQIVNLNVGVEELHDSPILYISGNQALNFTDEEDAKLKLFVEQGGMILGNADCSDPTFTKSFKALGMKLFKGGGEFRKIENDHPIYTRQQFPWKAWKTKPELYGLSNQVRELMLLIPTGDPGKAWQQADNKAKEEQFQLLSDIFLYAVESKDLRYKGSTYLVQDDPKVKVSQTVKIARLEMGDNADPEPGGWRRLSSVIHNGYGIDLQTALVKPDAADLKDYKIAHLTGTGKIKISDTQQKALKEFVDGGGTLVIDSAGGDSEFASGVEDALHAMFGKDADQLNNAIPPDHAIYQADGKALGDVSYRMFARGKVPRGQNTPLVRGITLNNRLAVVFSREDLSGGLVGESVDGIIGYTPESATAIMRDIVLFAIGGAKPLPVQGTSPAKPAAPGAPKPAAPKKPAAPPATKPAAPKK